MKHVLASLERSRKQFSPLGCPMKLAHASFSARKDQESSFHHCAGLVELVCASFSAGKELESSFHNCGGTVNLVHAPLSASNDLESSFQCCGRFCEARACLFQYQEGSRKQFSPLGCPMEVVQGF